MEPFHQGFSLAKLLSRVMTKILLKDGQYFRKKLLLTPVIYGDQSRLEIGEGVNLQNAILNTNSGCIKIGSNTFFGHDCMVLTGRHDSSLFGKARINKHPTSGYDIEIGAGVWVSSGAIILGGVKIVDNAIIAAGAVVTKDCCEAAVYAGIPAKKLNKS